MQKLKDDLSSKEKQIAELTRLNEQLSQNHHQDKQLIFSSILHYKFYFSEMKINRKIKMQIQVLKSNT